MKKHVIIYGQVQGVGFRNFTQMEAKKQGVKGWVRNNLDGTVELKAEGDQEKMEIFLEALSKGNSFSKVDKLEIDDTDHVDHRGDFRITG